MLKSGTIPSTPENPDPIPQGLTRITVDESGFRPPPVIIDGSVPSAKELKEIMIVGSPPED